MALKLRRRDQEPNQGHDDLVVVPSLGNRLADMLVEQKAVDATQVAEARALQQRSGQWLGELLIASGAIDEETLAAKAANAAGLTVRDLAKVAPDPIATARIPEPMARALLVAPISFVDGALTVAVADPLDEVVTGQLLATAGTGVELRVVVGTVSEVKSLVNQAYRASDVIGRHVQAFQADQQPIVNLTAAAATTAAITAEAPVVQVVNLIVAQALRDRASDVHIEPQEVQVRVRFRVDGALHETMTLPAAMGPALVSRIKILADMNIVETRRPQDGQFETTIDNRPIDVRVSTAPTIWGEKAVLRLLDRSRSLLTLRHLGMYPATHHAYSTVVHSPYGMVVCSGPTGSGKTTTLYATLAEIARDEVNVMTVEDPVEYVFPAANQMQISDQAGLTFASGLKSILRQDPDIILVGEIRDAETARIAVQSALTGHLVLSSLHATDAASALVRLLDMGLESFLIASAIVGVVGQRLVRRICRTCITPYTPSSQELTFYRASGGPAKEKFYKGAGCQLCSNTGYLDRIGVYEMLTVTEEIRQLIVEGVTPSRLRDVAMSQGLRPLRLEGIRLVSEDVTTIEEIVRSIYIV